MKIQLLKVKTEENDAKKYENKKTQENEQQRYGKYNKIVEGKSKLYICCTRMR